MPAFCAMQVVDPEVITNCVIEKVVLVVSVGFMSVVCCDNYFTNVLAKFVFVKPAHSASETCGLSDLCS